MPVSPTPLEDGTYSVREVTPPKGYKLDEKIYTFTINGGDTSLTVEDEPGTLTLRLKKEDSQTGSTPQGNASLAGAVYQVSYQLGGQTVTKELTSDSSGTLGTIEGIPFGTGDSQGVVRSGGVPVRHRGTHLHRGRQPAHRGCIRAGGG